MWKADLISGNILLYLLIKCYWIWWVTHQQHLSCRWLWGSRTVLWLGSLPAQVHVPRSVAYGNHAPCNWTVLWVEEYELFFLRYNHYIILCTESFRNMSFFFHNKICGVSYAVLQVLFAPRAQNQNPCIPGFCIDSDLYVVYVSMAMK